MSEPLVIISSRDTDLYSAGLAIAGENHRLVIHEDPAETVVATQGSDVALVLLDLQHYTDYPESLVTRLRQTPSEPELLLLLPEGVEATGLPPECCLHSPVTSDQVVEQGRRLLGLQKVRRLSGIVGNSTRVREVLTTVAQVGPLDVPVLVNGESGTAQCPVTRASSSARTGALCFSTNSGKCRPGCR